MPKVDLEMFERTFGHADPTELGRNIAYITDELAAARVVVEDVEHMIGELYAEKLPKIMQVYLQDHLNAYKRVVR
jgi:hypothetical protein